MAKVFVGHDWAEVHHDVHVEDDAGRPLAAVRLPEGIAGVRQTNQLRSTLREFYPAALVAFDDLGSGDALAVLAIASTPSQGRALSRSNIASALRRGGR